MSSEVKRYNFYEQCERLNKDDGEYVETADFQSERLAHEETKRNHASVIERLFYSERDQLRLDKELEETKKRLEELEDAVALVYEFNPALTPLDQKSRDLIFNAIENSKVRSKS